MVLSFNLPIYLTTIGSFPGTIEGLYIFPILNTFLGELIMK